VAESIFPSLLRPLFSFQALCILQGAPLLTQDELPTSPLVFRHIFWVFGRSILSAPLTSPLRSNKSSFLVVPLTFCPLSPWRALITDKVAPSLSGAQLRPGFISKRGTVSVCVRSRHDKFPYAHFRILFSISLPESAAIFVDPRFLVRTIPHRQQNFFISVTPVFLGPRRHFVSPFQAIAQSSGPLSFQPLPPPSSACEMNSPSIIYCCL